MPDIFDTITIPKKDIFDRISLSKKRDIFDTLGTPLPQPLPSPTKQEQLAKESTDYNFNLLTGTASEVGKEALNLGRKTFEPFVAMPYQAAKAITDPIVEAIQQKTVRQIPSRIENNLVDLSLQTGESMGRPLGFSGYEPFKESWTTDPYGSALAISPIVAPLIFRGAQEISARIPKKEPIISPEAKQAYTAGIQEIGQTLKNIPDEVRPQQAKMVADLRNQMRSALFKDDVATINSIVTDFREGQIIPTIQQAKPTFNIPEMNATTLREKEAKTLARQKNVIQPIPEYDVEMANILRQKPLTQELPDLAIESTGNNYLIKLTPDQLSVFKLIKDKLQTADKTQMIKTEEGYKRTSSGLPEYVLEIPKTHSILSVSKAINNQALTPKQLDIVKQLYKGEIEQYKIETETNAEFHLGENIKPQQPLNSEGSQQVTHTMPSGETMSESEHEAQLATQPAGMPLIGTKVRIGKSPQIWTITKFSESTPQELELGEQYVDIRNDKTGEISQNVQLAELKKLARQPDIFDKLEFNPEKKFRRQPLTPEEQKEVTKKSDIIKLLQQKLDIPIRYGRFRDRALGIFKIKPEIIRIRFANDVETASHEIGHALQKYLFPESLTKEGLSGQIFKEYQNELLSIASKPKAGQAKTPEGFAEFIRLYITNEPQARAKTPNFYNYFDNYLKTNQPEIKEIFAETRDRYNRYLTQTPEQRKISQISIGEIQSKTKEPFTEFYTKFLDELYPLRKVTQEMTNGKEIPAIQDPYKLARLIPGIAGKIDSFLEYKPFDYKTYTFYGKSLKEILNQIPKDKFDLYRAYQISKSEYESYQKKGIIADPISIEDAKFIIDKYDAEFGKIFKENVAFRDAVLRYFKDSGMLSDNTYHIFKKLYENYVPLYRVMDTEKTGGAGKSLETYQFIKERRGSWRDFIDPIESDIKNLYAMITLAEKNGVTTALVDLANSKQGMGKYVEKIPFPTQKIIVKTDEIMNQLSIDPMFAEMIKEFPEIPEAVSIFRKSAFTPKENVISNWKNGKQSLYQVHPDIARTIQALDKESVNAVIKILSYPAKWLRAGATLSPEFIGRNPLRDQFSAFVYSKYNFVPGYDLIKGIFHLAKKDAIYWKWKISGAEHSMLVSMDREYLQKTANTIIENRKIFNIEHIKDIIRNPIEALRALSEIGESGTRIGEFRKGIIEGNKKEILEAGYNAREVTLDFGRSGIYSKAINMIIAFWNAHNQGIDKAIRAFKENPYTTTWKVAASITLPSIILTLVNSQDERWKEIPRWQKDLFWIIMTKNHIWRIPKPFELGILFGTIPEKITEYIISQDKNAFNDFYKSLSQGFSPNILPTVAVPIVENWANKSIFLDRPIVPESKTELPPLYQYQPYTTESAKMLGKLINKIPTLGKTAIASPAKIENLIRGWTGGLGYHALKFSNYILKKTGIAEESSMPSKIMADIPFIKAFAVRYPSADTNSIQEFYEKYKTASQISATVKLLLKEGKIEKAKQLQKQGTIKDNMTYKALNNMNQTINNIYLNKKITPDEKRNLIDSIYLQMIKITEHSNKQNSIERSK